MKRCKKVFMFCLCVLLTAVFSVCGPAMAEAAEKNGDVVILYTSDIHCGVDKGFGLAGLQQVRDTDLKALREAAEKSGDAMDAQKANDLAAQCDRFEKKLHDLKLTRQISMQMAPQIRLLQNNNSILVERIQSTLVNTLPLWKNQMVLALGLEHSQQAMQAQKAVTDMTNDLLKKNAETLKMGTIETAKESERGIIDLETLVSTNQSLIDTINEVTRIQQEGRQKRAEAEKTLYNMEKELKEKLLNM